MKEIFISRHPLRPSKERRRLRSMELGRLISWLKSHPSVLPIILDLEEAVILQAAGIKVYKTIADYSLNSAVAKADQAAWHIARTWYGQNPDPAMKLLGEDLASALYPSLKPLAEEEAILEEIAETEMADKLHLEGKAAVPASIKTPIERLPGHRVYPSLVYRMVLLGWLINHFLRQLAVRFSRLSKGGWLILADAPNHCTALSSLTKSSPVNTLTLALNPATARRASALNMHNSGTLGYLSLGGLVSIWTVASGYLRMTLAEANKTLPEPYWEEFSLAAATYIPQVVLAEKMFDKLQAYEPAAVIGAVGIWPFYRRMLRKARQGGIPTFIVAHGNIAKEPAYYSDIPADNIITTSRAMSETLLELGIPAIKIKEISSWPSSSFWQPNFNPDSKNIVVAMQGFGGEMSYYEYAKFIDLLKKAVQDSPHLNWTILLHWQQPQHWPVWQKVFSSTPNVRMMTGEEAEKDLTVRALVTIFSTQAIEAAASGIPVITVNTTGQPEKVPLSKFGLAQEVHDANGLLKTLEDPAPPSAGALVQFIGPNHTDIAKETAEFIATRTSS